MSKIALTPNASGTGTLTVAAPNTNTDRTLTLPDVTTTLVGTDATQTLTNKSIAGSQLTGTVASSLLTGALPAIDGSALTGIATGGMTLLGTLATTSGTSVTLSGLTLTSYKMLKVVFNNVSVAQNGSRIFMGGYGGFAVLNVATIANNCSGFCDVELTTGVYSVYTGVNGTSPVNRTENGVGPITTATTSISFVFETSPSNFDAGSILIYGVK